MFEDIEEKVDERGVAVESDSCETPFHPNTLEDIHSLMAYGYEFGNDRLPDPKNKPRTRVDTGQTLYKEVWVCNVIDQRRIDASQRDSAKLDGIRKELIIVFTYLKYFFLLLPKGFSNEGDIMEINRRIKCPVL